MKTLFKSKTIFLSAITAYVLSGCGGGGGASSTLVGNESTISSNSADDGYTTIVPTDGYIYGASISCENGTATIGSDNLTFRVNSRNPGRCNISGGHHLVNGEQIPNDAELSINADGSNGNNLFATPFTTLVSAAHQNGMSLQEARQSVASLMGVDPDNASDVKTLLTTNPMEISSLEIDGSNFDGIEARSAMVSIYTMMEQFKNAGVSRQEMHSALNSIVEKADGSRGPIDVEDILGAVDDVLQTDKLSNQFEKISDLLYAQESMIKETGSKNPSNIESTVANTIASAEELEDTTASSEPSSNVTDEFVSSTTIRSYSIVDTNQNSCYNSTSGSTTSCVGTGYDGDYAGNQPSYTLSSSGAIVTDNITGLMWTQSSDLDGDGVTTDEDDKRSFSNAISYCSNLSLDGYTDWRLPDIKTLYSLILFSGEDPSGYNGDSSNLITFLDPVFSKALGDEDAGERVIDGQYATTTEYVHYTMNNDETMFGVNFVDGRIKGYPKTMGPSDKLFYVLCVRGNEDYGKNSFVDNKDKTITDNATGLMWEQDDFQTINFEDAISSCESSTTAGHSDWRLPNVKELQSIVDYSRAPDTTNSAAIDPLFNATSIINEGGATDWGYYWSSTTHATTGGNGKSGSYVSFGRALGYMNNQMIDVHGAGSQRSNSKMSESDSGASSSIDTSGSTYYYKGPQGDILRIDNMARCVRDASEVDTDNTNSIDDSSVDNSEETTTEESSGKTVVTSEEKFTLFSTMGSKKTYLLDENSDAIKIWSSNYSAGGASYLTENKTLLRAGQTTSAKSGEFSSGGGVGGIIEELDDNGNTLWSFTCESAICTLHHDFKEIDSEYILALSWEKRYYSSLDAYYWNEKILKISKTTGEVVWSWSAMLDGGVNPTSSDSADYIHLNSVDYKDGEIIVSSRSKSELWVINESTKEITSVLTAEGTLSGQHDATFLDNGNILCFNNGRRSPSSVVEIDRNDNIVWEYSNTFFSNHISGAQRLNNGNTLIISGVEGKIIEVTSSKEEIWSYDNAYPMGNNISIFKARRYSEY